MAPFLPFRPHVANHSCSWSFSSSLIATLKLCLTLPSPGPSLALRLPSPTGTRTPENPLKSYLYFALSLTCSSPGPRPWYEASHFAACPFPPQLCQAKGFICEFCQNEDDIIFPFELHKCRTCEGKGQCPLLSGQTRLNPRLIDFPQPSLLTGVEFDSTTPCFQPGRTKPWW